MPDTTIQGVGGAYSPVTDFNVKASVWAATINITTVEDTGFEDAGWESHKPTKIGISGTASGTGEYDSDGTTPIPAGVAAATAGLSATTGAMTLTAQTGCTLAFTAQMQSVGFNRANDGKLDMSHSFVSVGALTLVWDETS